MPKQNPFITGMKKAWDAKISEYEKARPREPMPTIPLPKYRRFEPMPVPKKPLRKKRLFA